LRLDGRPLGDGDYTLDAHALTVPGVRDGSVLESTVRLRPSANTALQGLYLSGTPQAGFLLTQCEAQGFRRITFFPDRPDVLARYTVELRAELARFPLLLANGNPAGTGVLADGRNYARWEDPHPKPSYLFALVAGQLECLERSFVTAEGRAVWLRLYSEAATIGSCGYAMDALQRAMRWDETHYGRCYDLDVFHVVATRDFNMGAMENKGLNIFNAKYLVADPDRSTDDDYRHVEAIVAHEYFHNWTGNRVTCRDWFQLSLKEGLTVFREQQFCADMGSPALTRIEQVQLLRRAQFPEDAGPLAHAVRPDHYSAIDNFYTATVYDKGAELVRMIAGRLGPAGWRRGMDEYFRRHDGEAATVEQFLAALGEANGADLSPYLLWYEQAGTPRLEARGEFDAATRSYTLTLRQHTAPTPHQPHKLPLPIPLRLSLFDDGGRALPLRLAGEPAGAATERMLEVDRAVQRFRFVDVERAPRPSLLRGFSAPVLLDAGYAPDDLAFLLRHESDGYNRWEAAQQLARLAFGEMLAASAGVACATWLDALSTLFDDATLDPALLAELLTPPDALELAELSAPFDPGAVHAAREALEQALAGRLAKALGERHAALLGHERGELDGPAQARRRLANRCLALWARVDTRATHIAAQRCAIAPSMTERLAALATLAHHADAQAALADFEERYRHDANTLDKWFALQATIPRDDTVERVAALLRHPQFSLANPNCAFALLRSFAARNLVAFHRADGAGYALLTAAIGELDALNPQIAARLATTLKDWRRLEPRRRELLQARLRQLAARPQLSNDLADILGRALS
jgi:aminopeptidase N